MQAVLLAAGEGERCKPLTETKPKSLLKVANKPIIEYNLDALSGFVDEVIIVVGHLKDKLEMRLGNYYGTDYYSGIKIRYVTQTEQLGTWHALMQAKPFIRSDKIVVMNTDDFYSKSDVEKLLKYENAVLGKGEVGKKGVIVIGSDLVKGIDERAISKDNELFNTGLYVFTGAVFDIPLFKPENQKEYYLTDLVGLVAKEKDFHCEVIEDLYLSVSYPWDLLEMNKKILKGLKKEFNFRGMPFRNNKPLAHSIRYDERELKNTLKDLVIIGDGCEIVNSAIEGPVIIGENCKIHSAYIRPYTAIGDNCIIGCVEIKNSIIGDKTKIPHSGYVGDSVIGDGCNIGAGTKFMNQRIDKHIVKVGRAVMVETKLGDIKKLIGYGEKINTGLEKLGAIVGDNVSFAGGLTIQPGMIISTNLEVLASILFEIDYGEPKKLNMLVIKEK